MRHFRHQGKWATKLKTLWTSVQNSRVLCGKKGIELPRYCGSEAETQRGNKALSQSGIKA
ncbi:hypothetical protein EGI31_13960 [Lacihabitans soyangensis]|uniref:Uncharacterized protein n=1 Tax=Lacihabitans soyangensis TaxID=869394 RepID=A0AAE3H332_9BACT|nr:hypothetical protein [Lacihabitans soyangensis]